MNVRWQAVRCPHDEKVFHLRLLQKRSEQENLWGFYRTAGSVGFSNKSLPLQFPSSVFLHRGTRANEFWYKKLVTEDEK